MKAQKLLNFLNEAAIHPDFKVMKAVTKAMKSVYKVYNSLDSYFDEDQIADGLFNKVKEAGKKFKILIEITHKYNTLEGSCGNMKESKDFWLDIYCDKTYTYKMWSTNRFDEWLASIIKVLGHELVHVEQMRRILKVKPAEFDKILDNIIISFLDSKGEITNFDKYLTNGLELMAYAKSTWDEFKKEYDKENALELLKRSKGWTLLRDCSKIFAVFYERQDNFPKLFKKYLKYLVDYIEKGK